MFGQKNWMVILVTRAGLQIFNEGENVIQSLPLPSTIIDNLEVINKDALYTLITDWIKQKTYIDTSIIWILSPELCFSHTITSTDQDKMDSETLQFLDTVPFEEVLSRTYSTLSGKQLVATNKALVSALIQGFALHGYSTQFVIPGQIVQLDTAITPDFARALHKRSNELEKENLILPTTLEPKEPVYTSITSSPPAKPKSSLPLLLTIFGVLVAILGFVLYLNQ